MIIHSRKTLDELFVRNEKQLMDRADIILYKHFAKRFFDKEDLVDECYLKLSLGGYYSYENEDHFLSICYRRMRDFVRMKWRRESFRKEYMFDPQEVIFSDQEINSMSPDMFITNVFDVSEETDDDIGDQNLVDNIKFCIDTMKNNTYKRIINLLSMGVGTDRIGEIIGVTNKGNLRFKIHEARKSFFKNLQSIGIYSDKKYSDLKFKNTKTKDGYNSEFENVYSNKIKYMYEDFPEDATFENKLIFVISRNKRISKEKIAAILAVNEYKEAINATRIKTGKYLEILKKQNKIHIAQDGYIFIN